MIRIALILALAAPLAACSFGKPVYSALPDTGELTDTRLKMAAAQCAMRRDDKIDATFNAHGIPDLNSMVEDGKNCFLAQGIVVQWRGKDGKLSPSPFTH